MQQHFLVTGRQLEPFPLKPVFSDFYVPSEDHHNRELAYLTLSMIGIGAFCGIMRSTFIIFYYMSYNYNYVHLHRKRFGRWVENIRNGKCFTKKYNGYHPLVHEIDHMSDLHINSSFHKQSMKIVNSVKIKEWIDSSIGQSTVIQTLEGKRPALSNLNQTQNRRRYVNFENGSHFICSLNLNNPESTAFITFKMTNIASGNQEFVNSLIGNTNGKINAKHITFYITYSGLGLLISKVHGCTYTAIANDSSSLIPKSDLKFPSSKSNCTDLNGWHVISVPWSTKEENLCNYWSNGEKLISFTTGNVKRL